jgi:thiamine biosynthesis lipoprotein
MIGRKALFVVGVITLVCLFVSCKSAPTGADLHRYEFKHAAMGTQFTITLYATSQASAEQAADMAFKRVDALEDILSDYQADSELLELCGKPYGKPVKISEDLFEVLERAQHFSELTDGAFDVTVGPFVRLWRFSRKRKILPTESELLTARASVGWRNLQLDRRQRTATLLVPNMRLDVGGIGKGFTADKALGVLRAHGITRAIVAASGDIAIGDPPPGQKGWKIGIATIDAKTNETTCTLLLKRAAVSTAGDSEQFIEIGGQRYSHILDPRTGLGLTNRIQVSVIAKNATTTDVLDTSIAILGPEKGLRVANSLPGTAVVILLKSGTEKTQIRSKHFDRLVWREQPGPR